MSALARRLLDDARRKAGLRPDPALERKLARLIGAMGGGIMDADALEGWARMIEAAPADSPEWLGLIENLTNHETYFFRDAPHHEHLRAQVLARLIADRLARGERRLKMWSAGCATGEEAYALAILALEALLAAGRATGRAPEIVTDWDIDVLGTDISRVALAQARDARYGSQRLGPFRDPPVRYAPWFPPLADPEPGRAEPGGARVAEGARRRVRFAHHNLMAPTPPDTGFDLVSCRNVLVHFDDEARWQAQAGLVRALAVGGYLVLGTTDRPLEPERFERVAGERALVWRLKEVGR